MEDLKDRTRAAEDHVIALVKNPAEPIARVLQAFVSYRALCQERIFSDFEQFAARESARLWRVHSDGKRYFHVALTAARKHGEKPVEAREITRLYLKFIKDSMRFYRGYINALSQAFGGIPELEAVAHHINVQDEGESSQKEASPVLRKQVLKACHLTLVYLGDLSRYRASEKLDKQPDFGPVIGYYDLACALVPSSGIAYHQRAVVALEQKRHLTAIYFLYRAIVAEEPHPLAPKNLELEFEKTNQAWDRGELIVKGTPNDPQSPKHTLEGWFVRLHSMCFKGEPFRGYEELETEVLGQLTVVLKHSDLSNILVRLVLVNLSAQYHAAETFKVTQTETSQNTVLRFLRFNVKTFTALLQVLHHELKNAETSENADGEIDLTARLTLILRHVLPALRIYSAWLLPSVPLLAGVAGFDQLANPVDTFWTIYAKTVDLIALVFPIWDLDELPELQYLLQEDADTLGFKPLMDEKTNKLWFQQSGARKPRWSDAGIKQLSGDTEMLVRAKSFLADGVSLATYEDQAPIKVRGTRILHADAEDAEQLPTRTPGGVQASGSHATRVLKTKQPTSAKLNPSSTIQPSRRPNELPPKTSRHAQLSRMVDDLVDDDEVNNPITPPQHHTSNPAVVTKGDVSLCGLSGSSEDFAPPVSLEQLRQKPGGCIPGVISPPRLGTPGNVVRNTSAERLQTVSRLWDGAPSSATSTGWPAGLPVGTLGSPAQFETRGHSRVNSVNSLHSRTSQTLAMAVSDSMPFLESGARAHAGALASGEAAYKHTTLAPSLLFGAGGSEWTVRPEETYREMLASPVGTRRAKHGGQLG